MPKPWQKNEIGYMRHPKFLALNGNATSLWHEAKDYCASHLTDGLIPREALKTFRFSGEKSIGMLITSIDMTKPNGAPYAPLWEVHPIGFKMHDYLDHNDCREVVLERLADANDVAELKKIGNRTRQQKTRAERKAKIVEASRAVTDLERDTERDVTRDSRGPTVTTTETTIPLPKNGNGGTAPAALPPRPMSPIHDRSHRSHAICGRVCLHASLFNDFVRRRNHDGAEQEIRDWADGVIDQWTHGAFEAIEPGDAFDFWKARYAEQWPAAAVSSSKLPAWAQKKAQA